MPKARIARFRWDASRGQAVRPYRLWDAVHKCNVAHRNFVHSQKAHMAALFEARWAKPGATFEVYDCTTGRLLGQYTRTPTSIAFQGA